MSDASAGLAVSPPFSTVETPGILPFISVYESDLSDVTEASGSVTADDSSFLPVDDTDVVSGREAFSDWVKVLGGNLSAPVDVGAGLSVSSASVCVP
ncbi:MAG: hypothetical protein K2I53_13230 [Lachnospiraceae bacterium]|nr:hypothetical protein [Lachnospiraceae bacterium]